MVATLGLALIIAVTCGVASWALLRPAIGWLRARALAEINHRSGHVAPTPQGAGIVVIPVVCLAIAVIAILGWPLPPGGLPHVAAVVAAALLLMAMGFADDAHTLSVAPRLLAQMLAVGLVLATLPGELRAFPGWMPLVVERAILFVGTLWFVNLTNFMDGMDGISATETLAITGGIIVLALIGAVPPALGWWAAALGGAMAGFVPWNAPPARVFLGDAGSLPLGLLLSVLLVHTASAGALGAALILAAYYLADATLTLGRRAWRGERVWEPHRDHFYQQALRQGWRVGGVLKLLAAANAGLVLIAAGATLVGGIAVAAVGVSAAAALTGFTLWRLARPPARLNGS